MERFHFIDLEYLDTMLTKSICLLPYDIQDLNTFHWVIGILPAFHRALSDENQFS